MLASTADSAQFWRIGQNWPCYTARPFHALFARISCYTFLESLKHTDQPWVGFVTGVWHFIKNGLSLLWVPIFSFCTYIWQPVHLFQPIDFQINVTHILSPFIIKAQRLKNIQLFHHPDVTEKLKINYIRMLYHPDGTGIWYQVSTFWIR